MRTAHSNPPAPSSAPAAITVVESQACDFCEDAHRVLGDLATDFPLQVTTIPVTSVTGHELMATHRAGMSPLVLLDGAFFSQGRLPRRKLMKVLTKRYGSSSTRAAVVS